jgi:hypothetical protein
LVKELRKARGTNGVKQNPDKDPDGTGNWTEGTVRISPRGKELRFHSPMEPGRAGAWDLPLSCGR